jgi:hypothetical protein
LPKAIYNNLQSYKPLPQYQALLLHEQEHWQQQKNGGFVWFVKYIFHKDFRFYEELKAYKVQQQFLKKYKQNLDVVKISKLLSGMMYLWCTSFENARKKLEE